MYETMIEGRIDGTYHWKKQCNACRYMMNPSPEYISNLIFLCSKIYLQQVGSYSVDVYCLECRIIRGLFPASITED